MKVSNLCGLLLSVSLVACSEKAPLKLDVYGKALFTQTALYLGPQAEKTELRLAGNHLNCSSCHLNAGTSPTAMGFAGIVERYPRYRALENRKITLEERIQSCFERSLNGQVLPEKESQALQAYIQTISADPTAPTSKDVLLPAIDLLERAAQPEAGKKLYSYHCAACHGAEGAGLWRDAQKPQQGYTFPPLWGPDSYGQGANLNRLIIAARYIKANMPLGRPVLTTEEAFDVAAYINSQTRPVQPSSEKDYPDRLQKPIDVPYPPYADSFSLNQHRWGPFKAIIKAAASR
jgi:thiosulfate dehydrogenase